MRTTLAVIPARGGSKGILRKNVAPIAGKPLIAWRIQQALATAGIGRVIVSTEDDEIAEISRAYGADVPFARPNSLATDTVTNIQVVMHALQWLSEHEQYVPEYVCLLQPTSPLCLPQDIDAAIEMAYSKQANAVISVTESQPKLAWLRTMASDGAISSWLVQDQRIEQRQYIPSLYVVNGAIYVVRAQYLLETGQFEGENTFGYVMSAENALDVDSYFDLFIAEQHLRSRQTLILAEQDRKGTSQR